MASQFEVWHEIYQLHRKSCKLCQDGFLDCLTGMLILTSWAETPDPIDPSKLKQYEPLVKMFEKEHEKDVELVCA